MNLFKLVLFVISVLLFAGSISFMYCVGGWKLCAGALLLAWHINLQQEIKAL